MRFPQNSKLSKHALIDLIFKFLTQLATMASYSLMKIAFLESLGIGWVLSNLEGFVSVRMQKDKCKIIFWYFVHLGVVKVGLLRLANMEVIGQCIIFTKKIAMKDRALTTPNNSNF